MAKTGRPISYSQEIADAICEELAMPCTAFVTVKGCRNHATVYR